MSWLYSAQVFAIEVENELTRMLDRQVSYSYPVKELNKPEELLQKFLNLSKE
jgi:hypothetical protein